MPRNNAFYRGILSEMEKLAEIKPPTPTPSTNQPPQVSPPTNSPAPQLSPQISQPRINNPAPPLPSQTYSSQIRSSNATEPVVAAPTTKQIDFSDVDPNIWKHFLPAMEKQYAQYPKAEWPNHLKQDMDYVKNNFNLTNIGGTNVGDMKTNPILTGAAGYMKENWAHPIDSYNHLKAFQDKFKGIDMNNVEPGNVLHSFHELTKTNPQAADFWNHMTHGSVDEGVGKYQDLGDVWNAATGKTKSPWFDAAVKEDPTLRDYASGKMMDRGGELLGGWLKNNWGKLALGVGGAGVLMYLLKNLMSESNQQGTQNTPQNMMPQQTSPRFL